MGKVGTSRTIDLLGQAFNRFTVLKKIGLNKSRSAVWACKCVCGARTKVVGSDLIRGRIKSCGCLARHGKCKTVEYAIFHSAKHRAKLGKIPFTLKLSDIVVPLICPVLDIPIHRHVKKLREDSPSLERIYPTEGYVLGNVAVISHKANRMKGESTPEELIALGEKFRRLHATLR
jgi:hypothetical protein